MLNGPYYSDIHSELTMYIFNLKFVDIIGIKSLQNIKITIHKSALGAHHMVITYIGKTEVLLYGKI